MIRQRTASRDRIALFISLMSLIPMASASAQSPTFGRRDYPTPGSDYLVADFNGDGKLDLAGLGAQAAALMLGNGDGTFQPRAEFPVAGTPQALAAGDFNRDGALDLMVTINDPSVGLALLRGRGNGTFDAAVHFPNTSGFDAPAVVAVDLDNDGALDVAVAHQIACYTAPCVVARILSVMHGRGDGTFSPAQQITIGSGTAAIGVGDFNRDGVKDLALASDSSRVHILLGAGNGTFAVQTLTLVAVNNIGMDNTDIDVADVNGDTIDDLVVALSLNGSRTVILVGNGDGSFRSPLFIQEPALRIPQSQAVADYNGDGRPDLAMALAVGNQGLMEVRNGNGDGTFGPLVLYLVPPPLSSIGGLKIIAAQLNGDGKPDLALAWGGATSGLAVLRNTTGVAPPPQPAAPSLLAPADGAILTQPVTLDWTDVANATSYEVQVDDSSTIAAPLVANPVAVTSAVTLGQLPAQRLWWRVRARNSAGVFGPFSSTRRFTPQSASGPASLSTIAVSPSAVSGGTASTGTVTLTSAAPSGGAVVALVSGNAAAAIPASVTVASGVAKATFTATTKPVSGATAVAISATYAGVTRTATLTVNPPGQTVTLSVTATGRSGERVTSNPAGINVLVGTTGSASFNAGTAVTLSVSNGRDAIWSGACSSGGNKTKTCTFTLNASASVTASVQ